MNSGNLPFARMLQREELSYAMSATGQQHTPAPIAQHLLQVQADLDDQLGDIPAKLPPGTSLSSRVSSHKVCPASCVGHALRSTIKSKAFELGCKRDRLGVVDTNLIARALYRRRGFIAEERRNIGPLGHLFDLRQSTTPICRVKPI